MPGRSSDHGFNAAKLFLLLIELPVALAAAIAAGGMVDVVDVSGSGPWEWGVSSRTCPP